jgi:hypothetical protein
MLQSKTEKKTSRKTLYLNVMPRNVVSFSFLFLYDRVFAFRLAPSYNHMNRMCDKLTNWVTNTMGQSLP